MNRYYNPAAFVDLHANRNGGAYCFGNYPRVNGDARMRLYFNEDFSIIRNIRVVEAVSLQFKAELLNAFNRHVFATPEIGPFNPTFGIVSSTIDSPRVVQFTLHLKF